VQRPGPAGVGPRCEGGSRRPANVPRLRLDGIGAPGHPAKGSRLRSLLEDLRQEAEALRAALSTFVAGCTADSRASTRLML